MREINGRPGSIPKSAGGFGIGGRGITGNPRAVMGKSANGGKEVAFPRGSVGTRKKLLYLELPSNRSQFRSHKSGKTEEGDVGGPDTCIRVRNDKRGSRIHRHDSGVCPPSLLRFAPGQRAVRAETVQTHDFRHSIHFNSLQVFSVHRCSFGENSRWPSWGSIVGEASMRMDVW